MTSLVFIGHSEWQITGNEICKTLIAYFSSTLNVFLQKVCDPENKFNTFFLNFLCVSRSLLAYKIAVLPTVH